LEGKKTFLDENRVARFLMIQYTKMEKNIPNYHLITNMAIQYTKWL
jgi:hypothetical protein